MLNSKRLFLYRLLAPMTLSRMFRFRARFLKWTGAVVGAQTAISASTLIHGNGPLEIGDRTWIGFRSTLVSHHGGGIYIGNDVEAGQCLSIVDSTHDLGPTEHRAGETRFKCVRIGDGCWIGMNVTILPGVTIGPGCVIAAGAVVTQDVPPNSLVAGVPAVVKKMLT